MPKSIMDTIIDHPVESIVIGLLGAIAVHKIYTNVKKHDPTLACFLDNVSSKKQKPQLIADVVRRVEECQGKKMNRDQITKTIQILQGNGGIIRDNNRRVWLTTVGVNTIGRPEFKQYHQHLLQNRKIAA